MAKTPAEYQKAYRERKKAMDIDFLSKERARVKGYRKPVGRLTRTEKDFVRERNKLYSKNYRDRKRAIQQNQGTKVKTGAVFEVQSELVSSSSSLDENQVLASKTRGHTPLLVKLSFPGKRRVKRTPSAIKRAHSRIQNLNEKILSLRRTQNKWKKRFQRAEKKVKINSESEKTTDADVQQLTPRTKTTVELRREGVSPRQLPKSVVKKLVMSNAVLEEVKEARHANPKQKIRNVATRVISGQIIRKYKLMSALSRTTGIGRRQLAREQQKVMEFSQRSRKKAEQEQLRSQVVAFIEQDDVSVMMPGKGDAKVIDGEKRQIRILTDYMSNIHQSMRRKFR